MKLRNAGCSKIFEEDLFHNHVSGAAGPCRRKSLAVRMLFAAVRKVRGAFLLRRGDIDHRQLDFLHGLLGGGVKSCGQQDDCRGQSDGENSGLHDDVPWLSVQVLQIPFHCAVKATRVPPLVCLHMKFAAHPIIVCCDCFSCCVRRHAAYMLQRKRTERFALKH